MPISDASHPTDGDHAAVLTALEEQLAVLDRLGAGIAAAHLDAAIQQLRLDHANCRLSGERR